MHQQLGTYDCGLVAIASAYLGRMGINPAQIEFHQKLMRLKCIDNNIISFFRNRLE